MYKFSCGHIFSFPPGIQVVAELLGQMINANCWLICVTSCGTCNCVLKWLYHFICSLAVCKCKKFPVSLDPCPYALCCGFWMIAVRLLVKQYLAMVWFVFPWRWMIFSNFLCACWLFVFILGRNMHLDPLPTKIRLFLILMKPNFLFFSFFVLCVISRSLCLI